MAIIILVGVIKMADSEIQPRGVAYVESRGMAPWQKLRPGASGEIGTYQMTPPMFQDLQRVYPTKYKGKTLLDVAGNDAQSLPALLDSLAIIRSYQKHYGLPMDRNTTLQIYNLGIGSFRKGKRNPAYLKTYYEGLGRR